MNHPDLHSSPDTPDVDVEVYLAPGEGEAAAELEQRLLQVYGNIDYAGLRLITCGGAFDYSARSYENNNVAYASLVSSHHT